MSSLRCLVSLPLLALLALAPAAAQERRPVSFEDLLHLRLVSDPAASPDGRQLLFTVAGWEREGDGDGSKMSSVSHLYLVPAEGGDVQQLTFGKEGESSPAWSPDGAWMSFLSARAAGGGGENDDRPKRQIWLLRTSGGEAFRLTDVKEGVSGYAWSPDARSIAFTARESLSEEEEKKRKRGDDPLVYEGDDRVTQLWTIEIQSRDARQRTRGRDLTVRGTPSWSPDGSLIAFTGAPTLWLRDDREDVYLLSLDSDGVERISRNPGQDWAPAFSPDGARIAFLSTPTASEALPDGTLIPDLRNARLALYEMATKTIRDLGDDSFDRIPGEPHWSPDGERLFFIAGDRAYSEVYEYELASRRYRKRTSGAIARLGAASRDGSVLALTLESSEWPAEVYLSGPEFQEPKRLTNMNPEVAELALGRSRVITWKSNDGTEVEGVLLEPVGFEAHRRYPLLVVPHGGPTGAYLDNFRARYGDGGQHWAGQGWAVLYPNPRGSTNYGEEFMRGNLADWGGGDYRDILSGVDAVIAMGIADPDRLAIQGWSYGGYMTCWTVSQTTRFKAAMVGAGLTNLVSMYGTNDVPNYLAAFFNGTLSPETEHLYRERSGLTHIGRVKTPTLILHGAADERVPIGQPMEFFRGLKDRGVPVELVFYPREGHGLQEYYHRLDRMKRQYEWITRHTLGAPETATSGR